MFKTVSDFDSCAFSFITQIPWVPAQDRNLPDLKPGDALSLVLGRRPPLPFVEIRSASFVSAVTPFQELPQTLPLLALSFCLRWASKALSVAAMV